MENRTDFGEQKVNSSDEITERMEVIATVSKSLRRKQSDNRHFDSTIIST